MTKVSQEIHSLSGRSARDNLRQQPQLAHEKLILKRVTLQSSRPKQMPTIFEISHEHNHDSQHEEEDDGMLQGCSTTPKYV